MLLYRLLEVAIFFIIVGAVWAFIKKVKKEG